MQRIDLSSGNTLNILLVSTKNQVEYTSWDKDFIFRVFVSCF